MSKVIAHIDLNRFFVRCEELKDPSLEGKAVAIGHSGRSGIISTCSYEARRQGVSSGMPTFKAVEACPNLILLPVDFDTYHKKSKEFFDFLRRYTKIIHAASIDEAYADFTEALKGVNDPYKYFKNLQDRLYKETGLFCSIGVGTTLFIAKMGSDYKKPMGITIIHNRDIEKILYPLPIENMYGIGKKTTPRLKSLGINTIGDLKERIDKEDPLVKGIFGKYYFDIKAELEGKSSDIVETEIPDPKSIGHSTTLPYDTDNEDLIKDSIRDLSLSVAEGASREDMIGDTIGLTVKDTSFITHQKSKKIDIATNEAETIYELAASLYDKNFKGM
ncbi:MAG: DNA polymerase IV, partial [Coprobacillus sp.]|nr:DNA polymerase IV [Coprobacillus sp.]